MTCATNGEACATACLCACGRPAYHVASPFAPGERYSIGQCDPCARRRVAAYDAAVARYQAEEARERAERNVDSPAPLIGMPRPAFRGGGAA